MDDLLVYSASASAVGSALIFMLRSLPVIAQRFVALRQTRAEAARAEADALKIKAEANREREETGKIGRQTEQTAVEAMKKSLEDTTRRLDKAEDRLDKMSVKLDECEEHRDDCNDKLDEMTNRAIDIQHEVDFLRREMVRKGWTPPAPVPVVPRRRENGHAYDEPTGEDDSEG